MKEEFNHEHVTNQHEQKKDIEVRVREVCVVRGKIFDLK